MDTSRNSGDERLSRRTTDHMSESASLSEPTPPFPGLGAFLRVDQTFGVLDAFIATLTTLMFVSDAPASVLHAVFLCLMTGAMYWRLPAFAGRTLLWTFLVTIAMVNGAASGTVTQRELVQLPMLLVMLLLVFLLARQRARMAARLTQVAGRDSLTGLPGRDRLVRALDHAIPAARDNGDAIVVLSLDLDGLRSINDRFGDAAGDQVLATTAKRLRATVRDTDVVARVGGDEFMILLSAEPASVPHIVERIVATVQEPIAINGETVSITASIGVALCESSTPDLKDTVLRHADAALEHVKAAGKAGYEVFSPVAA
jgi:diguanylate cyclase (GGDEF)-like protein